MSKANPILLGVPQGSILGPLFFLIFINDLLFFLADVLAKLFADDTTLYCSGAELDELRREFERYIKLLLEWCSNNRIDINWTKTFFMVITNKRIKIPESFIFNNIEIKCVNEFKLLGVTLDSKLSFNTHVSNLSRCINSKLFSIKRIFYLSTSVKVQFFKTFILPYFDYCSTLMIYFSKSLIQKLCNKYYLCLHKLFKIDFSDFTDFNKINDYLLEKFSIPAFQHRSFQRLSIFSYKMLNCENAPKVINDVLLTNYLELSMFKFNPLYVPVNTKELRSRVINNFSPDIVTKFKLNTMKYFFNIFFNCFDLTTFNLSLNEFKSYYKKNINYIFTAISKTFVKFNLTIKNYSWIKALS